MGFKFNPFSGTFDATGASDAAPFAGQVDAYADLPLDSTAALNSRWLVKNNSGTWPFSTYKQAGIYIRVNTVGASRDNDYQFVGTLPSVMNDNEFLIYDDADATKNLKFQLSGITTGTTRTLTVPNGNATIAAAPETRNQTFFSSTTYNVAEGLNVELQLQNSVPSCAIVVVLPRLTTDGARNGDEILLRPTSLGSGSSYTLQRYIWTGSSYTGSTENITTMEAGQTYRLRLVGGMWTLLVTPNLASPPAIGSTTPAAATFTNLTANTRVNLPNTNGTTAGDIYRNANTLRYRDSTNTERLLLNATDNLSNLANTATARANLGLGTAATANLDALSDSAFRIADNGDATKKLAFELSGISTGTTRTLTVPDASGTIALTSQISKTYAVFTATDNQPPASNYATLDTRNSIAVLDFDDATDESAVFVSIIPEGASLGSGLKIRLHWMSTNQTSGNVVWDVSLERMNTDLDSDSFDTIASGTAAANTTQSGILTVTEITLTTIDSVTAGDAFRLKVTRDANNASDTMTNDAELVAVEVRSAA